MSEEQKPEEVVASNVFTLYTAADHQQVAFERARKSLEEVQVTLANARTQIAEALKTMQVTAPNESLRHQIETSRPIIEQFFSNLQLYVKKFDEKSE